MYSLTERGGDLLRVTMAEEVPARAGGTASAALMPAAEAPAGPSDDWLRAARRAKQLSWLSLVWMGAEGAIAITAGVLAGSIALIGFGIDWRSRVSPAS